MTLPTPRAPPRPSSSAMSPYVITMPSGIVSTTSSTSSANSLGAAPPRPGCVTTVSSVDRQARVDVAHPRQHATGQVGDVGAAGCCQQPGGLCRPHAALADNHHGEAGRQLVEGSPVTEPV